VLPVIKI